jgi:hypothetical protein
MATNSALSIPPIPNWCSKVPDASITSLLRVRMNSSPSCRKVKVFGKYHYRFLSALVATSPQIEKRHRQNPSPRTASATQKLSHGRCPPSRATRTCDGAAGLGQISLRERNGRPHNWARPSDSRAPAPTSRGTPPVTSHGGRTGPGYLNRFSASISGASTGVRPPSGLAAG